MPVFSPSINSNQSLPPNPFDSFAPKNTTAPSNTFSFNNDPLPKGSITASFEFGKENKENIRNLNAQQTFVFGSNAEAPMEAFNYFAKVPPNPFQEPYVFGTKEEPVESQQKPAPFWQGPFFFDATGSTVAPKSAESQKPVSQATTVAGNDLATPMSKLSLGPAAHEPPPAPVKVKGAALQSKAKSVDALSQARTTTANAATLQSEFSFGPALDPSTAPVKDAISQSATVTAPCTTTANTAPLQSEFSFGPAAHEPPPATTFTVSNLAASASEFSFGSAHEPSAPPGAIDVRPESPTEPFQVTFPHTKKKICTTAHHQAPPAPQKSTLSSLHTAFSALSETPSNSEAESTFFTAFTAAWEEHSQTVTFFLQMRDEYNQRLALQTQRKELAQELQQLHTQFLTHRKSTNLLKAQFLAEQDEMSQQQYQSAKERIAEGKQKVLQVKANIEDSLSRLQRLGESSPEYIEWKAKTDALFSYLTRHIAQSSTLHASLLQWVQSKGVLVHRTLDDYTDFTLLRTDPLGGEVVRCTRNNSPVVLKKLSLRRTALQETNLLEKRIKNELNLLLRHAHHPLIIDVNGIFFEQDKYICIEMPYHTPLREYLNTRPARQELILLFCRIAEALKYLHLSQIEHRDLKMDNIVVCVEDKTPRLIDFEISKDLNRIFVETSLGTNLWNSGAGTNFYLPPEEVSPFGKRDSYALGVLLYECFANPSDLHRLEALPSVLPESGHFCGWLRDCVLELLSVTPTIRPSTIDVHARFQNHMVEENLLLSSQLIQSDTKLSLVRQYLQTEADKHLSFRKYSFYIMDIATCHESVWYTLSRIWSTEYLLRDWTVELHGQTGVDAGGLSRYLLCEVVKRSMSEPYVQSAGSHSFTATDTTSQLHAMKCVGKLMMRCLLQRVALPWRFTRFVFSFLVGREPTTVQSMLSYLSEYDPQCAKNMHKVLNDRGLQQESGCTQQDVEEQLRALLYGEKYRRANLEALREGFYYCVSAEVRRNIEVLTGEELKLVLCDQFETFEKDKLVESLSLRLRASTQWDSCAQHRQTREWLLEWLRESSVESLKRLMMMLTSFPTYTAGQVLTLRPSTRFYGHTCSGSMEIDTELRSREAFVEALDMTLSLLEYSAFHE